MPAGQGVGLCDAEAEGTGVHGPGAGSSWAGVEPASELGRSQSGSPYRTHLCPSSLRPRSLPVGNTWRPQTFNRSWRSIIMAHTTER